MLRFSVYPQMVLFQQSGSLTDFYFTVIKPFDVFISLTAQQLLFCLFEKNVLPVKVSGAVYGNSKGRENNQKK